MLARAHAPHLNRDVVFGRRRPRTIGPRLRLARYLQALPPSPAAADYSGPGGAVLRDVLGNDQVGDCIFAAGYHVVGIETGNAGRLFVPTLDQILKDYSAVTGYDPADPNTDRGGQLPDALAYWSSTGFADGTKLTGWLAVDPSDVEECKAACYLFENLFLGIELPNAWTAPFPSGDGYVWDDGAPNPDHGHAIMAYGYDDRGLKIDSWGLYGTVTWPALAHLASSSAGGELYVLLTPDQLAKGQDRAPNGVAWADLVRDFDAIGGSVPIPAPPRPVAPVQNPLDLAAALYALLDEDLSVEGVALESACAEYLTSHALPLPARLDPRWGRR